ncbi:MAG: T9SS type A sorting domain-containing protein [Ignavibacteria bacterium]|nr:MAG: T9SS type A sorting domain-containing protein [Ignavibacteria bacterium]
MGGSSDDSYAGAAWVFTRSAGVWTQQGTKLVGTGAVGLVNQGFPVSLSGNGNTAIVGGNRDNSNAGAAWMYVNGQPRIASAKDVPQDQGGDVFVNWNNSSGDVPQVATVTSYWVWRGVRASGPLEGAVVLNRNEYVQRIFEGQMTNSKGSFGQGGNTPAFSAQALMTLVTRGGASPLSGDIYWQYITSLPSHGLQHYSYASPTLADSTADGIPWRYFFITAATDAPDVYWDSPVDSGYSVDNLPPGAVTSIAAQAQAGPTVHVHWARDVADPDVGYYELHRSTSSNFIPTSSTRIGRTSDTTGVDGSPVTGTVNYYRIVTVDIHGNKSAPSPRASAAVSGTAQYTVADNWNMVSVPLTVSDYHKTALYPTGVSNAFAYQGGYVVQPTLANGVGYWVKFNGNQSVSMTGFVRTMDSIGDVAGWNMIGSISAAISVSSITTVPAGIVTSQFFGYNSGYQIASTIDPGQAYWVKVNQAGKLYLASSGASPQGGPINIVAGRDTPPPPPDQTGSAQWGSTPTEFALGQNYPNPFNPSTTISYSLPVDVHVVLKLFDALGQEVMTIVDETQSAGYKSVTIEGNAIPSGVYCYRITAGAFIGVKKLLLIR